MKLAVVLGILGATSLQASPYYVGQNIDQPDHINLGFTDTFSKEESAAGRNDKGNIAAVELNGIYNFTDDFSIRAGLPFYFANTGATGTGTSRNAMGNVNAGANFIYEISGPKDHLKYGLGINADIFAPTSRKDESNLVALANPTTDLYRYRTRGTSLVSMVHAFAKQGQWSGRMAFGGGFTRINKKSGAPVDVNRINVNWQAATSYEATRNIFVNLEYNTVLLGQATRTETFRYAVTSERSKLRHAITPSVSGTWNDMMGAAYVTVPLDKPTRDYTTVAVGINAGYQF